MHIEVLEMIKIKIKELLDKKNKSIYWLAKETNISQNAMGKIVAEKTNAIKYENLNAICKALDCKIEHIIEYIPDNK